MQGNKVDVMELAPHTPNCSTKFMMEDGEKGGGCKIMEENKVSHSYTRMQLLSGV